MPTGQWILIPCTHAQCVKYSGYWSGSGKANPNLLKYPCEEHDISGQILSNCSTFLVIKTQQKTA